VLEVRGKALKLLIGDQEDWFAVERMKRHSGSALVTSAALPMWRQPRRECKETEQPAEDSG